MINLHRLGPVAFLVSLIFCSSLSAQTDQPLSVQVSGLALWTDEVSGTLGGWDRSMEGQIRWTRGAWSFGSGVQSTTYKQTGNFSGQGIFDYDASTLGIFLEPKFVVTVFADRFGLYVFGRMTLARITENESGTRPELVELPGGGHTDTGQLEAYSVDETRTSLAAFAGPGLLIRLTSYVNLDLGVTGGFAYWGQPDTGLRAGVDVQTISSGAQGNFVIGVWAGLVIGIR